MKKLAIAVVVLAFMAVAVPTQSVNAQSYYFSGSQQELIQHLYKLIADIQNRNNSNNNNYGYYKPYNYNDNYYYRGNSRNVGTKVVGKARGDGRSSNDDEPNVSTDSPNDVDDNEAELRGEVDMNDFNNGEVFFVYGEDEDQIEDVEDDYDSYSDVDEDGDDLQKFRVDSDLDRSADYELTVRSLDDDTEYFYQICVGYEDDDDDDVIECGGVEDFETDDDNRSSNDDEPDATTDNAQHVEDDEAELHGEVDMNDFDDGEVFFVYGEDEDQIEDVEDDYDSYSDVDEDGDDLQKVRVDSGLDGSRDYWRTVSGLDDDTEYFYQICVGYEDDDDDDVLECGGVEDFETDD